MGKDDAFWLRTSYILFAAIVAFTAWKATETIGVQTGWGERYDEWFPHVGLLVSIGIGVLSTFFLASKKDRHEYFLSSITEMRKVKWPTVPDTRRMTLVVCVVVGVFAAILAVFDLIWAKVLGLLLT